MPTWYKIQGLRRHQNAICRTDSEQGLDLETLSFQTVLSGILLNFGFLSHQQDQKPLSC